MQMHALRNVCMHITNHVVVGPLSSTQSHMESSIAEARSSLVVAQSNDKTIHPLCPDLGWSKNNDESTAFEVQGD